MPTPAIFVDLQLIDRCRTPCESSSSLSCNRSTTRSTLNSPTSASTCHPIHIDTPNCTHILKPFRTTEDDGVECKHGPTECLGNIIELCARDLYPDPKINLGFIMCLTKDYRQIPDRALVEDCALEHAIDFDALNECATRDNGAHGMGMLRQSVERSAEVRSDCALI